MQLTKNILLSTSLTNNLNPIIIGLKPNSIETVFKYRFQFTPTLDGVCLIKIFQPNDFNFLQL